MGCSASVVLLLRSVGGADCGHMCSRQDQMSVEAATPTLEGYTTTNSPVTIIIMVRPPTPHHLPAACFGHHAASAFRLLSRFLYFFCLESTYLRIIYATGVKLQSSRAATMFSRFLSSNTLDLHE